jgi:hypothetical protein
MFGAREVSLSPSRADAQTRPFGSSRTATGQRSRAGLREATKAATSPIPQHDSFGYFPTFRLGLFQLRRLRAVE